MTGATGRSDWRIGVLLVVCALALTIQEYLAPRAYFEWFVYDDHRLRLDWWTFWSVFGYVGMPLAAILALPGERLSEYHLTLRRGWAVAVVIAEIGRAHV